MPHPEDRSMNSLGRLWTWEKELAGLSGLTDALLAKLISEGCLSLRAPTFTQFWLYKPLFCLILSAIHKIFLNIYLSGLKEMVLANKRLAILAEIEGCGQGNEQSWCSAERTVVSRASAAAKWCYDPSLIYGASHLFEWGLWVVPEGSHAPEWQFQICILKSPSWV